MCEENLVSRASRLEVRRRRNKREMDAPELSEISPLCRKRHNLRLPLTYKNQVLNAKAPKIAFSVHISANLSDEEQEEQKREYFC